LPCHLRKTCCNESLFVLELLGQAVSALFYTLILVFEPQNEVPDLLFFRKHVLITRVGLSEKGGVQLIIALINLSILIDLRHLVDNILYSWQLEYIDIIPNALGFECLYIFGVIIGAAAFIEFVFAVQLVELPRHFFKLEFLRGLAARECSSDALPISILHLNLIITP